MPRFFIDPDKIADGAVYLEKEDAHHARDVLRVKPGEQMTVADFFNKEYLCTVVRADGDGVLLSIREVREGASEPPFPVTLLMGLPKGDKPELIVEKAVELGAGEIVFFTSRYTVVRCDEKTAAKKGERYQKIAKSAAQQCGRSMIPRADAPVTFREALDRYKDRSALKLICYEKEEQTTLRQALERAPAPDGIVFMVGAEGGFSPEEAAAAKDAGFLPVTLGRRILRCETAPLCVLSQIAYHYGY